MIRFLVIIFWNLSRLPYMVMRMRYMTRHRDKFSEETIYKFAQSEIEAMNKAGKIITESYGSENLPKEGGYVLFPNHQGKYDATAIIYSHEKPCTFVMDKAKSYQFFVREMVNMLKAKRLELNNLRQGLRIINEMTDEVKKGRIFIIFSEGGYKKNHNRVQDFKPGSFKSAVRAKCPIVPVTLIDTYKPLNSLTIGKVVTKVIFNKPLYYEDYKDMKTPEIANIVKDRIISTMEEYGVFEN
ncbi:MAG: 1-acyl-sn-glycerol-3-phosphate acyltransferase [Lachnospiraceae bacterium]|nr:1-acyl-sn-glycerol-3-phosphate acyltransferase [Lachnospiraceae bacterium]